MAMQRARESVDIDRVAREAMRVRAAPGLPDLLKVGFPFEPSWVQIVVEPIAPPTTSEGGIAMVGESQEAEEIQNSIGRVLKAGPAAMEGQTASGIKLSNFLPGIQTREQLIGKFVVYKMHTGQAMTLRRTGQKIRVMHVTDLIGTTEDPTAWKFYI